MTDTAPIERAAQKSFLSHVAEHKRNWDINVLPLKYAYNIQGHRSTNLTQFSLVLSRHPPGSDDIRCPGNIIDWCNSDYTSAHITNNITTPIGDSVTKRQADEIGGTALQVDLDTRIDNAPQLLLDGQYV